MGIGLCPVRKTECTEMFQAEKGLVKCLIVKVLEGFREKDWTGGGMAAATLNFPAAVVACLCSFPLPPHFPSEQPNEVPAGKVSYVCSLQTSNPLQQRQESPECPQTGSGTG